MFRLACDIPRKVTVACSGGVDSMSLLHFVLAGRRDVTVAHFNHATPYGEKAFKFVKTFTDENELNFVYETLVEKKPPGASIEKFWRDKRYEFFRKLPGPILTAHHLNDVAEWWLMSALRGRPKLIPPTRKDPEVIRPFLLVAKRQIMQYALHHGVSYMHDDTNDEALLPRGIVRNEIMDIATRVNPGFLTTMKNLYGDHLS